MSEWIIWGSELSPFTLKVAALCRKAGVATKLYPSQSAGRLDALRYQWRLWQLQAGRLPLTWPDMTAEDEFPLLPFLFGPQGQNLYDSTAIAHWLDQQYPDSHTLFVPTHSSMAFVVQLIDDYADEWGLYMAHHNRWVVSAAYNNAGARLATEYAAIIPAIFRPVFGKWFAARQVRRLPYLFSVADGHFSHLPVRYRPPKRVGFAATHALLDESFERFLACLEAVFSVQPALFGAGFTLADASIYGQLAMNLDDPSANLLIKQCAPCTWRWLQNIKNGIYPSSGPLQLHTCIQPLLAEIMRVHVPLMQQNNTAYQRYLRAGHTVFNEKGFNAGKSCYAGQLAGQSYQSVAKSFQAKVWQQCQQRWQMLTIAEQQQLASMGLALDAFAQT